ncbi:L,D-transpeptidase family protein [Methylobacterium organophilum]|uniref:L,D-transpeptidase family protein n=1 Tax=Methylobacterium organophilum TaxID=410 RepID=UPI001F130069|nr:L,D-transpeptidase family protein [Methylobacterium organophilum]UMY18533.1 L,D-transpeptidase family protein [Methylobacterium organophilum]
MAVRPLAVIAAAAMAISLGACQDGGLLGGASTRSLTPIPPQTLSLMQQKGMSQSDPILIRAYKKEAEMEVWKRGSDGRYALLKTYPICRWSGQLGPKTKQGDRQAPEGFYTITPGQMNPNSSYYLSFDVGYPNNFDRANGRTGNYIMVHGTCSSAGCFAMTDASMSEIYAIAREAFAGGQRAFQFQSYPFRMTASNIARSRNDPNAPFWKNLKEGSDYFEALRDEPRVNVCGRRYVFGGNDVAAGSCTPRVDPVVAEKSSRDAQEVAELVAKGTPAMRIVYDDGGQNPVFRPQPPQNTLASLTESEKDKEKELAYAAKEYARHNLGEVSRPESLAAGPQEIEVDAKGRPVLMAAAPTTPIKEAPGKKGKDTKAATVVAKQEPAPAETAKPAATPARISVADAEGDPSTYKKLLGNLFSNASSAAQAAEAIAPTTTAAVSSTKVAETKPTDTKAAEAKTAGPAHHTGARKDGAAPVAKKDVPAATKPQASAAPHN